MHRFAAGLALTLLLSWAPGASAQVATSPASVNAVEGNANSRFPFDPDIEQQPVEMRYQQVFAASDFDSVAPPFPITMLLFRADAGQIGQNGLSGVIADFEVRLSTTSRNPDQLSATFSQNPGGDEQIVFDGAVGFTPVPSNPPGPAPFNILLPLQSSFVYDWRQGNLLLEVRNRGGGASGAVDAELQPGDSVSRVLSFDADASVADTVDSLGLVVRFAPEPATPAAALSALVALAGLAAGRRHPRRRGRREEWWVAWDSNPEPTG